jgi:hypothetical protein
MTFNPANPYTFTRSHLARLIRLNLRYTSRLDGHCEQTLATYTNLRAVWLHRFPGESW